MTHKNVIDIHQSDLHDIHRNSTKVASLKIRHFNFYIFSSPNYHPYFSLDEHKNLQKNIPHVLQNQKESREKELENYIMCCGISNKKFFLCHSSFSL